MPRIPKGYLPHRGFVALAGDRAEPWRTLAGVAVAFTAGLVLYQLVLALAASVFGPEVVGRILDEATYYGDTPRGVLVTLFSFVFFATGLAMALQALHGRQLISLVGPWEVALADFVRTVVAVAVLFGGIAVLLPTDYTLHRNEAMPIGLWLGLLPVSLLAIAVQAGTEELFFRGYLQQQVAARVRAWPAWILGPSLLFAVAHWSPVAAGPNASIYVLWAFLFGVLAADLTARTGTLGAALGFHIATNAFALLGTALTGPGSGLALYLVPLEADAPEVGALMPVEMATLVVAWLAVRLALRV